MHMRRERAAKRKAGGWIAAGAVALAVTGAVAGAPVAAANAGASARHAAAPGDDKPNTLTPVYSTLLHGGYVSAGVGLRNLGHGTITITGIPAHATVAAAYLLWDILGNGTTPSFAQGTFHGHAIQGTQWASGGQPCWYPAADANYSYEADVTSLVKGNGDYGLSGFVSGKRNGADPFTTTAVAPLIDGASLVVVYQLASMPQVAVQIDEGAIEFDTYSNGPTQGTMTGFNAGQHPSVTTTYIVGDGTGPGNIGSVNGTTVPGISFDGSAPQAVANYSQGNLWDNETADVSSLVPPGATSITVGAASTDGDSLVDVGQVLSVRNGSVLPSPVSSTSPRP
jgi:Protein of unknown function (DUF3344)